MSKKRFKKVQLLLRSFIKSIKFHRRIYNTLFFTKDWPLCFQSISENKNFIVEYEWETENCRQSDMKIVGGMGGTPPEPRAGD